MITVLEERYLVICVVFIGVDRVAVGIGVRCFEG